MSQFPDYYQLLGIPQTATQEEVRHAYRKESLKTHPDRIVNASPSEKRAATERFQATQSSIANRKSPNVLRQAIADAYFVLSEPQRRKEYDDLYRTQPNRTDNPNSTFDFFSRFANIFGGTTGANTTQQPDAEGVFADVFEELLRPEVERRVPFWNWIGTACGGGLGFIIANVPGLMLGALAGNRLGAVRDAKGKSVAAVFSELTGSQRAEILHALALKVLGSVM